jgi:tetratricopeptide (TPR) repeat protein
MLQDPYNHRPIMRTSQRTSGTIRVAVRGRGLAALCLALAASACGGEERETIFARGELQERDSQFAAAITSYRAALDLGLTPAMRAEARYRLARSQVRGGDLGGALETLETMIEEDLRGSQLDVGPLFLELGDAWLAAGERRKAQIAWQLGRSVAPARIGDFNRRIERLIETAGAPGDAGDPEAATAPEKPDGREERREPR